MKKTIKFLVQGVIFVSLLSMSIAPAFSLAQTTYPVISAINISSSSATVKATGLEPDQKYKFKFIFLLGNLESSVTASSDGTASSIFSNLNPDQTYTVSLVKIDPVTDKAVSSGASNIEFKTESAGSGPAYINLIGTPNPSSSSTSGSISGSTTGSTSNNSTSGLPPSGSSSNGSANNPSSGSSSSSGSSFKSINAPERLVNCTEGCGWNQFMDLVNTVINFILFYMTIPIMAIMFALAGFKMITAGGGEAKSAGKKIFSDAVLGFIFAAGAWLIIKTILTILGYEGAWIGF